MTEWYQMAIIAGTTIQGASWLMWDRIGMTHPASITTYGAGVALFGWGIVGGLYF